MNFTDVHFDLIWYNGSRVSGLGSRNVFSFVSSFLSYLKKFFQLKKFFYAVVSGHVFLCPEAAVFVCKKITSSQKSLPFLKWIPIHIPLAILATGLIIVSVIFMNYALILDTMVSHEKQCNKLYLAQFAKGSRK